MPVPEILNTLREERIRLQRELATINTAIEQLEMLERGGRRPRGRPRRLHGFFEEELQKKALAGVVKKSA